MPAEKLQAAGGHRGRMVLWWRIHSWVAHAPGDSSQLSTYKAALAEFSGSLKRRRGGWRGRDEVGRRDMLGDLEVREKMEVDTIIFHYIHIWNSQRINS